MATIGTVAADPDETRTGRPSDFVLGDIQHCRLMRGAMSAGALGPVISYPPRTWSRLPTRDLLGPERALIPERLLSIILPG